MWHIPVSDKGTDGKSDLSRCRPCLYPFLKTALCGKLRKWSLRSFCSLPQCAVGNITIFSVFLCRHYNFHGRYMPCLLWLVGCNVTAADRSDLFLPSHIIVSVLFGLFQCELYPPVQRGEFLCQFLYLPLFGPERGDYLTQDRQVFLQLRIVLFRFSIIPGIRSSALMKFITASFGSLAIYPLL